MDLLASLRAVKERRWLFLISTLVALTFLILGPTEKAFNPVYSSSAKILLTPPSVVSYGDRRNDTPVVQSWFTDETTLRELVGSEELLTRVSARLQLKEPWSEFRNRIAVQILSKQSYQVTLFQISVVAGKPEASQQQTLVLVEEFIKYVQELSAREYASTRRFLVDLVAEANGQLKKAQQTLLKSKNIAGTKDSFDGAARRKADLQSERSKLAQEVRGLQAQIAELQSSSGAPPWAVLEQKNTGLDSIRDNLAKERQKLEELERMYLPNTEEVIAQRNRMEAANKLYVQEVSRAIGSLVRERETALVQREASLQSVEEELRRVSAEEPTAEERLQYSQRERQLNVWQENYLTLTRRLYEAKVNEQMSKRQGAFSILERPAPGNLVLRPGSKNRPTWQRYAFGIPFCFVFGFCVVLLQEYLRNSLRLQPKIEEALDLPVIGTIPRLPKEMTVRWERLKQGGESELQDVD